MHWFNWDNAQNCTCESYWKYLGLLQYFCDVDRTYWREKSAFGHCFEMLNCARFKGFEDAQDLQRMCTHRQSLEKHHYRKDINNSNPRRRRGKRPYSGCDYLKINTSMCTDNALKELSGAKGVTVAWDESRHINTVLLAMKCRLFVRHLFIPLF